MKNFLKAINIMNKNGIDYEEVKEELKGIPNCETDYLLEATIRVLLKKTLPLND